MANALPTIEELAEAGVHFGHRTRQWNPKMKPFIYGVREGIHIVNLEKTLDQLKACTEFINEASKAGACVVIVGTKRQAAPVVREVAQKAGVHFIAERWPGGLITNFDNIKKAIDHYDELRTQLANTEAVKTMGAKKKFALIKEVERLGKIFAGLVGIKTAPNLIVVVDPRREKTAVAEARRSKAKIVGIVDTNTDPSVVDYPVAANDDAIKSVEIVLTAITQAIHTTNASKAETSSNKKDK